MNLNFVSKGQYIMNLTVYRFDPILIVCLLNRKDNSLKSIDQLISKKDGKPESALYLKEKDNSVPVW